MKLATRFLLALFALALTFGVGPARFGASAAAQQPTGGLAAVLPLLDEQTLILARLDVAKLDPAALVAFAAPIASKAGVPETEGKRVSEDGARFRQAWLDAGGQEVFVAAGLADFTAPPPLVLAPVRAGGKPDVVARMLGELRLGVVETHGAVVLAGSNAAVLRAKENRSAKHADLQAALAVVDGSAVQLAVQLPADVRRVALELGPKLPPDLGLGTSEELATAFRWLAVGVDAPPRFGVKLVLQADGPDGARRWQNAVQAGLKLLTTAPQVRAELPSVDALAGRLKAEVRENRVELALTGPDAGDVLRDTLAGPVAAARGAAARTTSMNNLKQMALAMHNFHDAFGKFPAAASRDRAGKPLLSWRVLILPFVDQAGLYEQFKRDEPWDSPHNKQLISRIPKVYVAPNHEKLAAEGKTVYVAPTGEKSVFAEKDGASIAKIVDGTSNTILLVQAPPERAVIWTQPADWEYDAKNVLDKIFAADAEGLLAAFCDGSVQLLPKSIDAKRLLLLLQMNDGVPTSRNF